MWEKLGDRGLTLVAWIFFGVPVLLGLAYAAYLFLFVAVLGGAPCHQHWCP